MSTAPDITLSAAESSTRSDSMPAFLRWCLARSESYLRCSMSGQYGMFGATWKSLPGVPVPNRSFSTISSRSIACLSARRTSTSSNGAWSQNIGSVMAEPLGTLSTSTADLRPSSARCSVVAMVDEPPDWFGRRATSLRPSHGRRAGRLPEPSPPRPRMAHGQGSVTEWRLGLFNNFLVCVISPQGSGVRCQ